MRCAHYLRQHPNELIGTRLPASCKHHFLLHVLTGILPPGSNEPVLHILKNGKVEQKRLLLNNAYLCSPPMQINLVQIPITDYDSAVA